MESALRSLSVALVFVIWGCSPGADQPGNEATGASSSDATDAEEQTPSDAVVPEPSPATPATDDEIKDICKVYRKALRGRWDDERTRGEIRGLTLASAVAIGWRGELISGDSVRALDASRAVVTAAEEQGLKGICEPLAGLVALAEAMHAADQSLRDGSTP